MKVIDINDDIPEEKIYTPKARRINPQNNKFKMHKSLNSSNSCHFKSLKNSVNSNEKSFNLDNISLEEINEDFFKWNENLDEEICYDELSNILSCSTKDCSFSSQNTINKIVKRPGGPINKNVEFFDGIDFFDFTAKSEM